MSIISDALKKAEREKVLKEKIEEERARLNEALEAARQYDRLISEKLSKLETEGGKGLAVEETTEARPFQVAFPERRSRHGLRAFLYAFTFFTVLGIALFVIMKWLQDGREVVMSGLSFKELADVSGDKPELFPSEPEHAKIESVESAAESEPQTMPGQTSAPSLRQPSVIPYVLSGITKMGEDRFALINNQILRAGDWVNGATVKAILDEEVVLETTFGELKLKISR